MQIEIEVQNQIINLISQGYTLNAIRIRFKKSKSEFDELIKSDRSIQSAIIKYKASADIKKLKYLVYGNNADTHEYKYACGMIKEIISLIEKIPLSHYKDHRRRKKTIESIIRLKNGMLENFIMK